MAKYIEREEAMNIFGNAPMWDGYREPYPFEVHCAIVGIVNLVKEELSKVPAVDAVPVVRCKDCAVPHNKYTGCPMLNGLVTPPDFYCPFGERKGCDENG